MTPPYRVPEEHAAAVIKCDVSSSPPVDQRRALPPGEPVFVGQQITRRFADEPPSSAAAVLARAEAPSQPRQQVSTPPYASQVPAQFNMLQNMLLVSADQVITYILLFFYHKVIQR